MAPSFADVVKSNTPLMTFIGNIPTNVGLNNPISPTMDDGSGLGMEIKGARLGGIAQFSPIKTHSARKKIPPDPVSLPGIPS